MSRWDTLYMYRLLSAHRLLFFGDCCCCVGGSTFRVEVAYPKASTPVDLVTF